MSLFNLPRLQNKRINAVFGQKTTFGGFFLWKQSSWDSAGATTSLVGYFCWPYSRLITYRIAKYKVFFPLLSLQVRGEPFTLNREYRAGCCESARGYRLLFSVQRKTWEAESQPSPGRAAATLKGMMTLSSISDAICALLSLPVRCVWTQLPWLPMRSSRARH